MFADIDLQSATQVANEIESLGGHGRAIECDVSNCNDVERLVKETLYTFKKIDILVNNAGVVKIAPIEEMTESDWDNIININLKGPFLCCQAVGKEMVRRRQGKVINIALVGGHRGNPRRIAYAASKGGLLTLTTQLATEWAKYNINVNSVSPGMTITPMLDKAGPSLANRVRWIPLGRSNEPDDMANTVLFLASPESDNITGQDIIVDGGLSALYWPLGEE